MISWESCIEILIYIYIYIYHIGNYGNVNLINWGISLYSHWRKQFRKHLQIDSYEGTVAWTVIVQKTIIPVLPCGILYPHSEGNNTRMVIDVRVFRVASIFLVFEASTNGELRRVHQATRWNSNIPGFRPLGTDSSHSWSFPPAKKCNELGSPIRAPIPWGRDEMYPDTSHSKSPYRIPFNHYQITMFIAQSSITWPSQMLPHREFPAVPRPRPRGLGPFAPRPSAPAPVHPWAAPWGLPAAGPRPATRARWGGPWWGKMPLPPGYVKHSELDNGHRNNGFFQWKLWFSIVMFRLPEGNMWKMYLPRNKWIHRDKPSRVMKGYP